MAVDEVEQVARPPDRRFFMRAFAQLTTVKPLLAWQQFVPLGDEVSLIDD